MLLLFLIHSSYLNVRNMWYIHHNVAFTNLNLNQKSGENQRNVLNTCNLWDRQIEDDWPGRCFGAYTKLIIRKCYQCGVRDVRGFHETLVPVVKHDDAKDPSVRVMARQCRHFRSWTRKYLHWQTRQGPAKVKISFSVWQVHNIHSVSTTFFLDCSHIIIISY